MSESVDVLILGSGFGGSLLSTILAKRGMSVALLDRARHPRFAIGESSTPLADVTLAQIAREHDLPSLLPLTQYGSWQQTYPDLGCGLKRGFSYFGHTAGQDFLPSQQLLVAASAATEYADTHWLRSDVDEFLFRLAQKNGVRAIDGAAYDLRQVKDRWNVEGQSTELEFWIDSAFVVDATGASGEVLRHLGIPSQSESLRTNSSAVFAHFADVKTVAAVLSDIEVDCETHPFDCDAAAVHHVLDDGWMWQLRFDDQSVSAGMMLDGRLGRQQSSTETTPTEFWQSLLKPYPFLQRQFERSRVVRPAAGIQHSGRLQRLSTLAAGFNWAALPGSTGFIDPLHSTGIAHTLFGVRRLARILCGGTSNDRTRLLANYSEQLIDEFHFVDELSEGCYAALPDFRIWCAWCMLYFAAVTSGEQASSSSRDEAFLTSSDEKFRDMLRAARQKLQDVIDAGTANARDRFEVWLRAAIAPWNRVGLLDPSANGMYSRTAAPQPPAV